MRATLWLLPVLAACGGSTPSAPVSTTTREPLVFEEETRTCEVVARDGHVEVWCDRASAGACEVAATGRLQASAEAQAWRCTLNNAESDSEPDAEVRWRVLVVTAGEAITLVHPAPTYGSILDVSIQPLIPGDDRDALVLVESGEGMWWSALRWTGSEFEAVAEVTLRDYGECSRRVDLGTDGTLEVRALGEDEQLISSTRWVWDPTQARYAGELPTCPEPE
jgi:hypothetical protein